MCHIHTKQPNVTATADPFLAVAYYWPLSSACQYCSERHMNTSGHLVSSGSIKHFICGCCWMLCWQHHSAPVSHAALHLRLETRRPDMRRAHRKPAVCSALYIPIIPRCGMHALRDAVNILLARRFWRSECHTVWRYAGKVTLFTYARKKRTALPAPFLAILTHLHHHCVQTSCSEFRPNRKIDAGSAHRSWYSPSSTEWPSLGRFAKLALAGHLFVKTSSTEFDENTTNDLISLTDRRTGGNCPHTKRSVRLREGFAASTGTNTVGMPPACEGKDKTAWV
jgi:hypothetical protein